MSDEKYKLELRERRRGEKFWVALYGLGSRPVSFSPLLLLLAVDRFFGQLHPKIPQDTQIQPPCTSPSQNFAAMGILLFLRHLLYIAGVTSSLASMNSRGDVASIGSLGILLLCLTTAMPQSLPNSPSTPAPFQLKAVPTYLIPVKCRCKSTFPSVETTHSGLLRAFSRLNNPSSLSSLTYLFLS